MKNTFEIKKDNFKQATKSKSKRITKKSICLEFLNRANGASINEMAQVIVDRGIDPDLERNKRTCRLWMSKIGVPVGKTGGLDHFKPILIDQFNFLGFCILH